MPGKLSNTTRAHGDLGSARVSRVWFRRLAETIFLEKSAKVGHSPTRETRALPNRGLLRAQRFYWINQCGATSGKETREQRSEPSIDKVPLSSIGL